jgi:hypothetical protein
VYLVVDVVEEEYRQDTVPHVTGRDRRALIDRKLARLYRNTPYQYAAVQGREGEGRRDDRLLLTALTNPEQLDPIIRLLNENKIPLAGIYSLPILSKYMLKTIGAKSASALLVTLAGASGLRQTFLRDGEVKVSRLAKMPRYGSVSYGPHILSELDKFRRYLVGLRLASPESPVDVYIITGGNLLGELRHQARAQELVRYHLVNVADVGKRLGISGTLTTPYSDALFAHVLLAEEPRNQYAPKHQTRYFRLHRTRIGMMAASGLLLLGAAVWSGLNFIEALSLRQQSVDSRQKAEFYQARYEVAHKRLPPTAVPASDIKAAVDVVDTLGRYKATPLAMLRVVSGALADFPTLHIDKIDWLASTDPNAKAAGHAEAPTATTAPEPGVVPVEGDAKSYLYYQIAEVEGHIAPFDGNFRQALALVDRFGESLRASGKVFKVEVVKQPLDVSSGSSLQGQADEQPDITKSSFSVRVVMGVEDEKA